MGRRDKALAFKSAQRGALRHPGIGDRLPRIALEVAGDERLGERPARHHDGEMGVEKVPQPRQVGRLERRNLRR